VDPDALVLLAKALHRVLLVGDGAAEARILSPSELERVPDDAGLGHGLLEDVADDVVLQLGQLGVLLAHPVRIILGRVHTVDEHALLLVAPDRHTLANLEPAAVTLIGRLRLGESGLTCLASVVMLESTTKRSSSTLRLHSSPCIAIRSSPRSPWSPRLLRQT
jgi:hypothetical protein